ncbi:unnamed protein product [Meloidogyne enterolobii]|uniref:Uncharacterized protein n=1 Tax=Meloidogyne enterolobii TaxID=390850 RepID=A0ACB0ZJ93_MELEN
MNILLLPVEVHLDIFKHLNFEQVFSIQQTNSYFRSLIDKYKLTLAKKKFYSLETIVYKSANDKNKYLKLKEEDIGLDDMLCWSDDLREKWQVAVDNKTPMYLFSESLKTKEPYIINFAICLTKEKPKGKASRYSLCVFRLVRKKRRGLWGGGGETTQKPKSLCLLIQSMAISTRSRIKVRRTWQESTSDKSARLLLKLPYIPNLKGMLLWRFWLEKLLIHCAYEEKIVFENVIFNPIMIQLLFETMKNPLISLKMNYCESGTCADGGQFSFRMFPNFSEDMEKENASQNFPWLHYAKFAQLSCWIFLQDVDASGLVKELNFCFISTFGYRNRVPME